jgi:hypothetical protein
MKKFPYEGIEALLDALPVDVKFDMRMIECGTLTKTDFCSKSKNYRY